MSDVCAWVWVCVCVCDPQVRHNMWSNHQRMEVGVGYSDYCYNNNLKPPSYFHHQSSARPPRLVSHMWRRPSLLVKNKAFLNLQVDCVWQLPCPPLPIMFSACLMYEAENKLFLWTIKWILQHDMLDFCCLNGCSIFCTVTFAWIFAMANAALIYIAPFSLLKSAFTHSHTWSCGGRDFQ